MFFRSSIFTRILFFILLVCSVSASPHYNSLFKDTGFDIKRFLSADSNFQILRLSNRLNNAIHEVKSLVPANAKVDISPSAWTYFRCQARYALYPLELHPNDWDYFLDFAGEVKDPPPEWTSQRLYSGLTVYMKPGHTLFPNGELAYKSYPKHKIFWSFIGITIFQFLTGMALISLLRMQYDPKAFFWYVGTCYLIGYTLLTCATWFYLWAGGSFSQFNVALLWAFCGTVLIAVTYKNVLKQARALFCERLDIRELRYSFSDWLMLLAITVISLCIIAPTVLSPVFSWDAMSHWVMKAKVIFQHKQLVFDYTHHNEYPLFWPQSIANNFILIGGVYDETAKWTAALIFVGFLSQLNGGLRALGLKDFWVWMVSALYLICFSNDAILTAYAENTFMVMTTGMLASLMFYFKSRKGAFLWLACIFSLGLAATKLEGVVAVLLIAAAVASLALTRFRSLSCLKPAVFLALPVVVPILWICRQMAMGYFSRSYHMRGEFSIDKVVTAFNAFPSSLMMYGNGAVCFLIFSFMIIAVCRKQKYSENAHVLLVSAVFLIGFSIAAFIMWQSDEIDRQIIATMARIFFHATPPIVLYVGLKLSHFVADK